MTDEQLEIDPHENQDEIPDHGVNTDDEKENEEDDGSVDEPTP